MLLYAQFSCSAYASDPMVLPELEAWVNELDGQSNNLSSVVVKINDLSFSFPTITQADHLVGRLLRAGVEIIQVSLASFEEMRAWQLTNQGHMMF